MKTAFLCPHWGSDHLPFADFLEKVKAAGYDGVEVAFPKDRDECVDMVAAIGHHDLLFVAQHWDTLTADVDAHLPMYLERLAQLAETKPLFINSHSGRDHFSFAQNINILQSAEQLSRQLNLPIYHETHRGRFNFAAHVTEQFIDALPWLQITADFSHWCCVAESLLEDQPRALEKAIARAAHVHCRVGHSQGSQVINLALPVYQDAREKHLQWWCDIAVSAHARGQSMLTYTAEFGPGPYMLPNPVSHKPIADQWALNVEIMQMTRQRVNQILLQ